MAPDRRREELLRLLDEIEGVPQRPVGPHLDEEDLIGLTRGALSSDRETEVFEHIRSCADCADDALNVSDVLEDAAKARTRAPVSTASAAPALDPRAVGLMWMVAATAVWVAHRQKGRVVRLSSAGDSDRRAVPPRFEWAIVESGGDRFLRVRTRDEEWWGRPVNCVVYDSRTDRNVVEEWLMLFATDNEGYTYGETRLEAGAPTSTQWRAEMRGYESFDRLPHEAVTTLRRAFSRGELEAKLGGAGALAGRAWEAWLEREVATGRLTPEQASAITGKQA